MKSSKHILLAVAFIALALIGAALYLQHVKDMQPCPLCVIQRYAFAIIALICLVSASMPDSIRKASAAIGMIAGLGGAATAGWHLWVIAHPATTCGRDALEAPLNALPTAILLPSVFKVDAWALCSASYDAILGLSIPQWSLFWFVVLTVILGKVLLKRTNHGDFE
ncbi:disulfide bond formation protein B [Glaciimonas sp. Gout2]|uniref:disulfide bond formation protein B n=1 Tax=unclassified Glaciimonas TaxID=2644401 RepID=UPI002B22ABEC|nr:MULTISPECIES: disulfide bond formation protein B [unclassified Glaciimonas]MEB0012916.1 disulfide bond formation protein B [Glaciimonas sp. Cout2]MEB0080792.1 disulfide bond formation protein B [Glaciimonas sp. Gout2]